MDMDPCWVAFRSVRFVHCVHVRAKLIASFFSIVVWFGLTIGGIALLASYIASCNIT